MHAKGTFDVKVTPLPPDAGDGSHIGRMSIDKKFSGDIDGLSKGQMLAAMTTVQGSAGYVAMERVTATIGGRSGAFVLEHTGLMDRGRPSLTILVVPDSGTDGLAGIAGTMTIEIREGTHFYAFDYTLP